MNPVLRWSLLAVLAAVAGVTLWLDARDDDPAPPVPPPPSRMSEVLRRIAALSPDENPYTGSRRARQLRESLAGLPEDAPAEQRLELLRAAGRAELQLGNVQVAIGRFDEAERLLDTLDAEPALRAEVLFEAALAWLQLGERQNCCYDHNADSCIFPIQGGGVHSHPEGSTGAADRFARAARLLPDDGELRDAAVWLLNVAHMTLGTWPGGVPDDLRLSEARYRSTIPFPRFRNIAPELGLDVLDTSGGAVVEDFDGDGFLDILTSAYSPVSPMHLFRSTGDGRFVEGTREAGLDGILGGLNLISADYDNDGDVDVLVLRGAWLRDVGRHPNSLLRNDGKGRFEDVTFELGLAEASYPTQTAAFADYDNDGDLDLYVGNETSEAIRAPSQLFRNDGDRFVDVAAAAGVQNLRYTKGVTFGDFDGDDDPDLYVSNFRDWNRLYRNNGDGTFTDVATERGVEAPRFSFPVWSFDFDNDGALDIYVPGYEASVADIAAWYLGKDTTFDPTRLYKGDGAGGFEDVAIERGLVQPVMPMGSNFGDVDGDGYPDIYLGTGEPSFAALVPNVMFLNQAGRRFVDVTTAGGFGHLQKGHGVAFADFDHDGDLDVFAQLGGAFPGDTFRNSLFRNPGFDNRWICLKLEGVTSNRCAIGARIHVLLEDDDGSARSVYRHVSTGGSFGASPLRQTIGLGRAARIVRLEVHWPTSKTDQSFDGVALDRAYRVREGAAAPVPMTLTPILLGAAR